MPWSWVSSWAMWRSYSGRKILLLCLGPIVFLSIVLLSAWQESFYDVIITSFPSRASGQTATTSAPPASHTPTKNYTDILDERRNLYYGMSRSEANHRTVESKDAVYHNGGRTFLNAVYLYLPRQDFLPNVLHGPIPWSYETERSPGCIRHVDMDQQSST
jgi:hypothetical protein